MRRNRIGSPADLLFARRGAFFLVVALATAGFAVAASTLTFSTSPETLLETGDPAVLALREHEARFGTFEHTVLLVVDDVDAFDPGVLDRLARATDAVAALPAVESVRSLPRSGFPLPAPDPASDSFRSAVLGNRLLTPFLVSRDGRTTAIQVRLTEEADTGPRRDEALAAVLDAARTAGLDPLVAGVPAVRAAYAEYIASDLLLLPPIIAVLLLALLLLAFRRPLPVLGLLGSVGIVAVWTVGILAVLGGRVTALTSILPSLVLVIGVATGIHVLAQFREEREGGAGPRAAARSAMTKMALPCALTSLTTAVGFSSLLLAGIRDVREFGIYSALGSLLAFVVAVPLTGVLLSFGPYGVDRRGPPRLARLDRPLAALARMHVKRPLTGVLLGVAVAAVAVGGLPLLVTDTFMLEDVRADAPIHRSAEIVDRRLGGVLGFDLVVSTDGRLDAPENLAWFRRLEKEIAGRPDVRGAIGPATLIDEIGRAAPIPGAPPAALLAVARSRGAGSFVDAFLTPDFREGRISVRTGDRGSVELREARERILGRARDTAPAGVRLRTGGLAVQANEVLTRLVREMAKSTVVAFAAIFVLMSVIFRSVRVGALAMVPNMLPLLAAAGFMGYAGITVRSSIALIFAVALGIAVDDTIHMITRYRRERTAGADPTDAVERTVRRTGRPVVLTSIVLLAGFLTFTISEFKATEHFGLVASVTIVTALVGDLLLLPGLWLLGRSRNSH